MSAAEHRKAHERHLLERFLAVSGINASVTGEGETPDFEITLEGRQLGVELTELFIETSPGQLPLQAQESLTSRIISAARDQYERDGGPHVHVSVTFFSSVNLQQVQRRTLAAALARLVRRLPLEHGKHTPWHNDYEDNELDAIAFVNVLLVPSREMAHWSVGRAGWVAPLRSTTLESRIAEKSRLIELYRRRYPEVWLVIAVEGSKPSQFFDLDNLVDVSAIASEFDRTYFFSSFPSRVIRIGGAGDA